MKTQPLPQAVRAAFEHVRAFHPTITRVAYSAPGIWYFTDQDDRPVALAPRAHNGRPGIDVEILRASVPEYCPATFTYTPPAESVTFNTTNSDGWEFNPETGGLTHPCQCLTSWFRRGKGGEVDRGEHWVALEWADWHPDEAEIVRHLNALG